MMDHHGDRICETFYLIVRLNWSTPKTSMRKTDCRKPRLVPEESHASDCDHKALSYRNVTLLRSFADSLRKYFGHDPLSDKTIPDSTFPQVLKLLKIPSLCGSPYSPLPSPHWLLPRPMLKITHRRRLIMSSLPKSSTLSMSRTKLIT